MSMTCLVVLALLGATSGAPTPPVPGSSSVSGAEGGSREAASSPSSTTEAIVVPSSSSTPVTTTNAWPEYEPAAATTTVEAAAADGHDEAIRLWPGYWIKTDEQEEAHAESSLDFRTELYHIADLFSTKTDQNSSTTTTN
ncbi:Hypothetical predicted protein [Cloeon dipterum]|uniref:Uncharacterized protein n=1 Tax=Cloeon dipterum TaxID=197152 RepID=A0A8S1D4P1_9INSE|nr:Hypothetical predicted protein [Cloeon dipterum]